MKLSLRSFSLKNFLGYRRPSTKASDLNHILGEVNNTREDYPKNATIHQLFEESASRNANKMCIIADGISYTYREVNSRANQIAHDLMDKGLKPDSIVGVACDRTVEMIIGNIAVLKAGGAYVSLDHSYPTDRLAYMLEDTQAVFLLTTSKMKRFLPHTSIETLLLDQADSAFKTYPEHNPVSKATPKNLASVIYTSGSTGKPKGILLEHGSLVNFVTCLIRHYPNHRNDVHLHHFSFGFDVSVGYLFWPLAQGLPVVLATHDEIYDDKALAQLIVNEKVTTFFTTPTVLLFMYNELLKKRKIYIHTLFTGGEPTTFDLVEKIRKLNVKNHYNAYGPTETTVVSTTFKIDRKFKQYNVPVGKPLSNTTTYILDEKLNPVPIGTIGELYIGGVGVSRGYLNLPELTAKSFLRNPFATQDDIKNGYNLRIYKTGDLCQYLPDGNIEYLGRIDHQLKIRGCRVELSEVENAILSFPMVKKTVVMPRKGNEGSQILAAYIVPINVEQFDVHTLLNFLKQKLLNSICVSWRSFLLKRSSR
jgi:amino acid adenylation domain-containing protein